MHCLTQFLSLLKRCTGEENWEDPQCWDMFSFCSKLIVYATSSFGNYFKFAGKNVQTDFDDCNVHNFHSLEGVWLIQSNTE